MAFVSSAPLGRTLLLPAKPPAPHTRGQTCPARVRGRDEFHGDVAAHVLRDARRPQPTATAADFVTAGEAADLTAVEVPVVAVRNVSASSDFVEISVDVEHTGLPQGHVLPGQFVQVVKVDSGASGVWEKLPFVKKRNKALERQFLTIASSPGAPGGVFEFLVSSRADPAGLCDIKVGDRLRLSPVIGSGLDYRPVIGSARRLLLFADCPQGIAAAKSLLEWSEFKAASGSGANRTTTVTILYSSPSHHSIAYADRFSAWAVYGVTVCPIVGQSLLEYLSTANIGGGTGALTSDSAMACVRSPETLEALFCHLALYGLPRASFQGLTQKSFATEAGIFDDSDEWFPPAPNRSSQPFETSDTAEQAERRASFEREIWDNWVRVRDSMKSEFERKWAAQPRANEDHARSEKEKSQAWESWAAQNSAQWSKVPWDSERWGGYWSSWSDDRDSWTASTPFGGRGGRSPSSTDSGRRRHVWSKQSSENYSHYSADQNSGGWSGWNRSTGRWRAASSSGQRNWAGGSGSGGDLDFYAVLGLESSASRAEIKRAYRRKAMQHHPDRNLGNSDEAHVIMKKIVVAYTVLKDDNKRRRYDSHGAGGL